MSAWPPYRWPSWAAYVLCGVVFVVVVISLFYRITVCVGGDRPWWC